MGDPINENKLEPVLVAFSLLRRRGVFSASEEREVADWSRSLGKAEQESAVRQSGTTENNWHAKRLKLTGLIGWLVEDGALTR